MDGLFSADLVTTAHRVEQASGCVRVTLACPEERHILRNDVFSLVAVQGRCARAPVDDRTACIDTDDRGGRAPGWRPTQPPATAAQAFDAAGGRP